MTKVKPLREYAPFISEGRLDMKRLERLHTTVGNYRDSFLTDHDLQDALLNRGYHVEGERPTCYQDLTDSVFLRTKTGLHLTVVDHAIELVTKPAIAVAPHRSLWVPGQTSLEERWKTERGHDFERVEELQMQWLAETGVAETVRAYQETLRDAFGEFNMKFMLTRMHHAGRVVQNQWPNVARYQTEMNAVLFPEGVTALDNAYYIRARSTMHAAGPLWLRLQESDFGKFFILSPEEEREALRRSHAKHNAY